MVGLRKTLVNRSESGIAVTFGDWAMVTEEKAVELLPCPCCGSADVEIITSFSYGSPAYMASCQECPVRTDRQCGKESVVEAWNRRVGQLGESPFQSTNKSARSGLGLPKH